MKPTLLLLDLVLPGTFSYSQVNYPLVAPSKSWSILNEDPNSDQTTTTAYKFEGDTIIAGRHYYNTFQSYMDSSFANWMQEEGLFIREEQNGDVYRLINTAEMKIYDFGQGAADSAYTGITIAGQDLYATVSTADSVLIEGTLRKRIIFDSSFNEFWIEGIGSSTHVLYPFGNITSTLLTSLLCVKDSNVVIYQDLRFQSCYIYIVGIDHSVNRENLFQIFPNPMDQKSRIQIRPVVNVTAGLQIINCLGQIVRTITFTGDKFVIERDGLDPGLYTVQLTTSAGSWVKRLIIE
jgi:hypothetical protein